MLVYTATILWWYSSSKEMNSNTTSKEMVRQPTLLKAHHETPHILPHYEICLVIHARMV